MTKLIPTWMPLGVLDINDRAENQEEVFTKLLLNTKPEIGMRLFYFFKEVSSKNGFVQG